LTFKGIKHKFIQLQFCEKIGIIKIA
jgi:hypothetical protein